MAGDREAKRRWRERNPNYHREYYLRTREEQLARAKARREAYIENFRERRRKSYRQNPEPQKIRSREYRKREPQYLETIRVWHKAHPKRIREIGRKSQSRRRARMKMLPHEDVDPQVVFNRDGGVCGICGGLVNPNAWHLDHIVPLARGGPHSYANVQTTHPLCNLRKGGRGQER